jgi:hypothetical protein
MDFVWSAVALMVVLHLLGIKTRPGRDAEALVKSS